MNRNAVWVVVAGSVAMACAGSGRGLNSTTVTCASGRTFLDGVCVSESVADYVACVRAQGAQIGGSTAQKLSADVGTFGVRAGAASEISESLERKYGASEAVMLEIVRRCDTKAVATTPAPAAGATTPATATEQDNWRWCSKCQSLFWAGTGASACPAGGAHDGIKSANYALPFLVSGVAPATEQDNWRWCSKCQTLAFNGAGAGACAAGGVHDHSKSANYYLSGKGAEPSQSDWRWCKKCQSLAFGAAGPGVCPAGGRHDHVGSGDYHVHMK
jgi:hypothetical protein